MNTSTSNHGPAGLPAHWLRKGYHLALLAVLGLWPLLQAGAATVRYHYDRAGQLTVASYDREGTNAAVLFAYDAAGNTTNRLVLGPGDSGSDSDADGLDDLLELRYFGHLAQTAEGDPDSDGLSTSNELAFGSSPVLQNTDGDPATDYEEWVAGTDPSDPGSFFRVATIAPEPPLRLWIQASSNRVYTLIASADLTPGGWAEVPGQVRLPGNGALLSLTDTNSATHLFYRVRVELP
jgi:hypothetical protein